LVTGHYSSVLAIESRYEASATGYDAVEKRAELFDSTSRYISLIAKLDSVEAKPDCPTKSSSEEKVIGYAMFRFEQEETRESNAEKVLYL